jgi:glycosyltransferase involved in cell wall biosynthesis
MADVVVLTSRSEGVPVVLMEAMVRESIVLAPAITGIPELVIGGKTGFLYEPGSMDDFVSHLLLIRSLMQGAETAQPQFSDHSALESLALERIRHAARVQVRQNFNRRKNQQLLAELFLQRIPSQTESTPDESPLLQQI